MDEENVKMAAYQLHGLLSDCGYTISLVYSSESNNAAVAILMYSSYSIGCL